MREVALRKLREGVELEDGLTAPAGARRLAADRVELTIREGRKRQVRRMLEAVGHRVVKLERVAVRPAAAGRAAARRAPAAQGAEIEELRRATHGKGGAEAAAKPRPARRPSGRRPR